MDKLRWGMAVGIVVLLMSVGLLSPREFTETRSMMGTIVEIKVISNRYPAKAFNSAFSVIYKIDSLGYFGGTGDVAKLNKKGKNVVSKEIINIIQESKRISEITDGAFDITIRPLMEAWKEFRETDKLPEQSDIDKLLKLVNYKNVIIKDSVVEFAIQGMKVDLSGIAKGYAVDLAVSDLKSSDIKTGLVNAGGDIKVFGNKIWNIGIKNPRGDSVLKTLELKDCAVVTSGDYERYFTINGRRYCHIIDPRTGFPADGCMSVTIIADDCMFADALATGVFVLGRERGEAILNSLRVRGIIVTFDSKPSKETSRK